MSWIAIADTQDMAFNADAISGATGYETVLPRGTLMIETRLSNYGRVQDLLSMSRGGLRPCSVDLRAVPNGGMVLVITQGGQIFQHTLDHGVDARTDVLRISYSWDVMRKWARFAIERPETSKVVMAEFTTDLAFTLDDMREFGTNPASRRMSEDLLFYAFSAEIEPIGPASSLTMTVPICTYDGYRPAGSLQRGDVVRTLEGDLVPVLLVVHRTVPAKGSFQPVRLRAPYFGLVQDIVVAPEQRLVIGGSQVEYMFGSEAVLVPARHLVNGTAAVHETGHALVTYTQFLLPDHQGVLAAGTGIESIDIGRIRRRPELLAASQFAAYDRARLPEHSISAYPVLKPFEAITLAEKRAA